MDKIYKEDVVGKVSTLLQKANEWWDSGNKVNNSGALTIASIIGLILMSKISLFVVVALLGSQRVLYHNKFFTNEQQMPDVVDEDSKSE